VTNGKEKKTAIWELKHLGQKKEGAWRDLFPLHLLGDKVRRKKTSSISVRKKKRKKKREGRVDKSSFVDP